MTKPGLSIFFPAYNDAGTIASLALVAHMTARELTDDYEVIVVDDGSPDHTGELLDEMARHFPWLKVVHHAKNRGYGGALRTGFETASKELVFYTDGDAQYDPRELARLWSAFSPEVDFVNGYKISRHDPLHRIVIGRLYHWFVKLALRAAAARRRLRLPADAPERLREGAADALLRRHLRRADEEGAGPRLPDRRGAGAPLPPQLRQEPVLQLPARGAHAVDLARLWVELVVKRLHREPGSEHATLPREAAR